MIRHETLFKTHLLISDAFRDQHGKRVVQNRPIQNLAREEGSHFSDNLGLGVDELRGEPLQIQNTHQVRRAKLQHREVGRSLRIAAERLLGLFHGTSARSAHRNCKYSKFKNISSHNLAGPHDERHAQRIEDHVPEEQRFC